MEWSEIILGAFLARNVAGIAALVAFVVMVRMEPEPPSFHSDSVRSSSHQPSAARSCSDSTNQDSATNFSHVIKKPVESEAISVAALAADKSGSRTDLTARIDLANLLSTKSSKERGRLSLRASVHERLSISLSTMILIQWRAAWGLIVLMIALRIVTARGRSTRMSLSISFRSF